MEDNAWKPTTVHCPNCGGLVYGYKNSEGLVKLQCRICDVKMVLKQMGRRHDRIDVYANEAQERLVITEGDA